VVKTLGQHLIDEALPEAHRDGAPLDTKGALTKKLLAIAKEDPGEYVHVVSRLKRLGDEVSTLEGVSVGLEDLMPVYGTRDGIMKPALEKIKRAKTTAEREAIILDVQAKMLEHTKTHPGSMTQMALSGARGNIPQLMKTVASPVAAVDARGQITPFLIGHSYSEGLSPAEYWVTANEARVNTVKSSTSVSEPGDLAKIFVNTLYPYVIVKDDCGTHNGIEMSLLDSQTTHRYLAKAIGKYDRNTLLTPAIVNALRKDHAVAVVRSPMTCDLHEGVCRKCQGLDEKGKPHQIGINVGVRAAQALSEPMTQFALNAKHGVRILKGASPRLDGLAGIRQLIEIPQAFFAKAAVAEKAGRVTKVVPAPHGGTYVYVEGVEHYAGPGLAVRVREGQVVEAGDVLSEGVPKPDEVVHHKGVGAGRLYLVNSLHDMYKSQGIDVDKRHLELLARADVGNVRVADASPKYPELLKGDVIPYTRLKAVFQDHAKSMPLNAALGQVLGKELFHYTVGTHLTQSVIDDLRRHSVSSVSVVPDPPMIESLMKPMTRTPLMNPDWMARLSHRYLKENLVRGAHFGHRSNVHGVHPVPAYAHGSEFGDGGPEGHY